jgi:beta-lactamase regulating signal transducer with metallopeptidase domain
MSYSMEALGWTLVHFCWQAAVIALLYRVVDLAFAKSRSHVRYTLALVALMSMFAAAVVTLGYEEMQMPQSTLSQSAGIAETLHGVMNYVESAPTTADAVAAKPITRPDLSALSVTVEKAMPWVDAMWLVGVFILSARTIGGWRRIRQLRHAGLVEIPERVRNSFERLSQRIGIRRQIELYVCPRISGPLAMGVFRSLVLLPTSALTALSPDQLEVVLAHELAHIRRGDYLWNMIQTMVETLFFFHPAVWWVSNNLRQQRELCCDDVALACCSDPVVYATALLHLEEQRSSHLHLAMALDGHRTGISLRERIVRILGDAPERRREIAPLSLVGVCAVVGLFLLPLPHVFADYVAPAKPVLVAATVFPEQRMHVVVPEAAKCAPKVVFTQAPAHKEAPAVAPAIVAERPNLPTSPAVSPALKALFPQPATIAVPRPAMEPSPAPEPLPVLASMAAQDAANAASPKTDYITAMRAVGYNVDLDKYVAMKIQGVTPEYARSMSEVGLGKPTADELVSLKIFGVTPEYVKELKGMGIAPTSLQDLTSYKIFKVTPEFVAAMKAAGFSSIPSKKLVELRVHGVTPEFIQTTKRQFPDVTLDQLVQLRIFHIDDAFMASAKSHGFDNLTIEKLVKLRISGLLDDDNQRSEKR